MKTPDKTGVWHERSGLTFYVFDQNGTRYARDVRDPTLTYTLDRLPESDYLEAQRPSFEPPPPRPRPKIVYARLLNGNPDTPAQWVVVWPGGNQPANTSNPEWYELVYHPEQESGDARYFLDKGAKLT